VVVTTSHDTLTQEVARQHGATLVISDRCYEHGDAFNKGKLLNAGLAALDKPDWVLFTDADVFLPRGLREYLRRTVLNPGCLYYTRRRHLPAADEATLAAFTDGKLSPAGLVCEPGVDDRVSGYFQLWNPLARAIRDRGRQLLTEDIPCAAGIDSWFALRWRSDKRLLLAAGGGPLDVVHVPHGALGAHWNGSRAGAAHGWRFGGWINKQGIAMFQPWPADARLKLIGLNIEGSCEMPAAELESRVRFDSSGLIFDGQRIGPRLLLVTWRPEPAVESAPALPWQSSVVVWPGVDPSGA